jgi:hypothetical protein
MRDFALNDMGVLHEMADKLIKATEEKKLFWNRDSSGYYYPVPSRLRLSIFPDEFFNEFVCFAIAIHPGENLEMRIESKDDKETFDKLKDLVRAIESSKIYVDDIVSRMIRDVDDICNAERTLY